MNLSFPARWVRVAARTLKCLVLTRLRTRKEHNEVETAFTTKIEWGIDMDKISSSWSILGGPEHEYKFKGRCKSCWGRLVGRSNDSGEWTGIKCRVCSKVLEGADAEAEQLRILVEGSGNAANIGFEQYPRYGDGPFAEKIIPAMDRLSKEEFEELIMRPNGRRVRDKLTRSDFPVGSPGILLTQAKILMAGVEHFANPQEVSVLEFPEFDLQDDESLVVHFSMGGEKNDPQHREYRTLGKFGATMIESMISAFSCELVMKAICLTCKGEAIKTHDLLVLFDDLPEESRRRIEADYPEIGELMERSKQVFGKWRYIEEDVGESGLRALIDMERAHAMGKAARVMMDEAEIVGLQGSIYTDAKEDVRVVGERRFHNYRVNISVKGGESPPRR